MLDLLKFSLCESSQAAPKAKWHIRRLGNAGPKYGGGIDTPSLCGRVRPWGDPIPGKKYKGYGGWDLEIRITEHHLQNNVCPECRTLLLKESDNDGRDGKATTGRSAGGPEH